VNLTYSKWERNCAAKRRRAKTQKVKTKNLHARNAAPHQTRRRNFVALYWNNFFLL
jgi:hypothetical protein